ncbi:hypothetical protein D3C87_1323980 [compost metagenome]
MSAANSPSCLKKSPLAAPALVFFRDRYVAESPLSSAAIMDCRASAKPLKEATSSPSEDLPSSVVFGMALKVSIFFLASVTSCCTVREFSAAPFVSPAARCAAAMSARIVARSICV